MFGQWAATPWQSGTLCLTFHSIPSFLSWLQWQLPRMAIRDSPFHPPPSSSPLATAAGGQWVLTYPTDPYYPELLPTKPRPIPTPHNTLSSWLHPGYKSWVAISRARLLRPCSLGMVNLARECTLNKACFKPICFTIWLQFGLPVCIELTVLTCFTLINILSSMHSTSS
jgi:hypothetical protein